MLSATQIGTYAKFTPKQKATTLAILHVPSVTLANCPYRVNNYIGRGALLLQVYDDVNVPVRSLLV